MSESERVEKSSAKYAAIIGIVLMSLYGATLALWVVAAPDPTEETLATAVQQVSPAATR